jgi:dihydroxyacetone synthase
VPATWPKSALLAPFADVPTVKLTNTEDVNAKMRACGWNTVDVDDGNWDVAAVVDALEAARRSAEKPTFINVRTTIGVDTAVAGDAVAHGAALGKDNVAELKRLYGFNPEQSFVVCPETRTMFGGLAERGETMATRWRALVDRYACQYPELGAAFRRRMAGQVDPRWRELIPKSLPEKPTSSRAASGMVLNPIASELDSFMVGTADLSPSVYMSWPGKLDFQHVRALLQSTWAERISMLSD